MSIWAILVPFLIGVVGAEISKRRHRKYNHN